MMSNSKIMTLARKALKGFWLKSIGMTIFGGFISWAIIFGFSLISILFLETGTGAPRNYLVSFVFEMIETILIEILAIGFYAYLYEIYKHRKSSFRKLFVGFENFSRNAVILIIVALIKGFFSSIADGFMEYFSHRAPFEGNLFFYILLVAIVVVFLCYVGYKLLPTWVGLMLKMSMDDSTYPTDLIRQTFSEVYGYNFKFFCLYLRFIGWGILGCLTLGIGFLWIIPYMTASSVIFFDTVFNPEDYAVPEDPEQTLL